MKYILFFPGYLTLAMLYFFPTEWGKNRNTAMGGRMWAYRNGFAPLITILYVVVGIIYFYYLKQPNQ